PDERRSQSARAQAQGVARGQRRHGSLPAERTPVVSPIDLYIRRVTLGLPRRTRLDTAAELRVHLNERATALASQGLDQSEAEHLAVEYMGPIEPVNRKFLGHVLTPRLGWLLVGVLLAGSGAWAAANYLFAP